MYAFLLHLGNRKIVEVALEMTPGRHAEEAQVLIESYDQETRSKSRRHRKPTHAPPSQMSIPSLPNQRPKQMLEAVLIQDSKEESNGQVTKERKEENILLKTINSTLSCLLDKPSEYFNTDSSEGTKENDDNKQSDDDESETNPIPIEDTQTTGSTASGTTGLHNLMIPIEDEEWDCDSFSELPWTILISKQAADFLKAKKTSKKVIKNIKRKLYSLAEGKRGGALCHRNIQSEDNLYETYLTRESRIIWQETIQYSEHLSTKESKVYTDIIRVLWIATKHTTTQLNDVLQKIKHALKKSRNSQLKKSLTLLSESRDIREPSNNFKKPRHFTEQASSAQQNQINETYHPIPNLFGGEYSMMQFHSFPEFLDAYLKSDVSNYDTPICMSPQEHDIIHLPYKGEPIVLCGRSGTGKTTTCIYRMWNEYRTFWEKFHSTVLELPQVEFKPAILCEDEQNDEDDEEIKKENLNQVFITKSPVLCSQVQKQFEKLVNGYTKLKKLRMKCSSKEKSLKDYSLESYPLFLTSRQFLLLLDNSLPGKPFFRRNEEGDLLVHLCNSDYNQNTNPDRLFEDTLDIDHNEDPRQGKEQDWIEVTADFFCTKIWPLLQKRNTSRSKMDPLLVWIEIQSFIKGSTGALKSENSKGYLSRDYYVNEIGKKMAPTFTIADRNIVYDYFEEYNELLHKRTKDFDCDCLFDECDIVNNLFKRFPLQQDQSWHISHFYIDEVQDFTQAELSLLLKCSDNPNGTFCTGDTAQSIMKGVFFRFEDLKSQFWEMAQSRQYTTIAIVPRLHYLTDNFRAHSGILNLAQSIIGIMKKNFRNSFQDAVLPVEVAMFEGPQPILLDATSPEELTAVLLGNAKDSKGTHYELGAHQAILVRSEQAKDSLPESLKDGIVLTVLEAKGLEFNDVLLYDFFNDSTVNTCINKMILLIKFLCT